MAEPIPYVSETRIYQVEREIKANTWEFVGNLEITNYSIVSSLIERADSEDWPDGEYRLLHWDDGFACGSFFLVTLRSEKQRKGKLYQHATAVDNAEVVA